MRQQRRPDTGLLRARISLTCQIGGSVSLAGGPASRRKCFLSICELGTERLGGEYVGLEERAIDISYNFWLDWKDIERGGSVVLDSLLFRGRRGKGGRLGALQVNELRAAPLTLAVKLFQRWNYAK